MSAQEQERPQLSSVEISENSKGEPVVKVKVYAERPMLDEVDAAQAKAIEVYKATVAAVRP